MVGVSVRAKCIESMDFNPENLKIIIHKKVSVCVKICELRAGLKFQQRMFPLDSFPTYLSFFLVIIAGPNLMYNVAQHFHFSSGECTVSLLDQCIHCC